jgi:hypothetical protein
MAIDFNWISTAISSGVSHNGFGSIVSNPATGGGGNPPYGTILSTGSESMTSNFTYAEDPYSSGSFQWGSFPYYTRADGAGGTYLDFTTGYSLGTETATFNQVMDNTVAQTNYRIIYKGGSGFTNPLAGTWSECHRTGATGSGFGGDLELYISELSTTYKTGDYYTAEMYDGVCGTYNNTTNTYYTYGTTITSVYAYYDSENMVDVYAYYYHDGAGGYYVTYA